MQISKLLLRKVEYEKEKKKRAEKQAKLVDKVTYLVLIFFACLITVILIIRGWYLWI